MRVLVVTNDLPPRVGGIQYYVDQLARGLAAAGDDVLMYGSNSPGAAAWDATAPYRVVRRPTAVLLPTPGVLAETRRLVREHRAEAVVFGAAFPLGLMAPTLLRRDGVPCVAFTHGLEVSAARTPPGRLLLRRIGRHCAAVTVVSQWCDRHLRPAFGPGPRYALLPPAVDPERFHPGVDGTAVRRRHGLGDRPVVVSVGRLVARKGQDTLIAALPGLRRRVPDAAVLLVGDGPHRSELERLAHRHGVAEHVTFAGEVPDGELPAHFAAGDVFAGLSRHRRAGLEVEAFGIVVIQAQAVGVPTVAGDVGGVPDAVGGPTTGVLVDPCDVDAAAAALADLLVDPVRRSAMGVAGAARIARKFTWATRTSQLRDLLGEVTARAH